MNAMEHRCLSPCKGAVAGGLIVFIWSALSWMVFPFHDKTNLSMALSLLSDMIGAFFWTWILGKIPGLTLKDAALYGLFFGLSVGVLGVLPNWVWWKLPFGLGLLHVLDAAIAWTLASLAISRCYAPACAIPKK